MPSRKRFFFLATIGALGTAWSYSRRAVRRWEDLDLATVEKPGRVVSVDGVELHYTEAGQGPPILLIHGLNGSTFSFRHLAPLLSDGFRVLALDLMGFGYSERPAARRLLAGRAGPPRQRLPRCARDREGLGARPLAGRRRGDALCRHVPRPGGEAHTCGQRQRQRDAARRAQRQARATRSCRWSPCSLFRTVAFGGCRCAAASMTRP